MLPNCHWGTSDVVCISLVVNSISMDASMHIYRGYWRLIFNGKTVFIVIGYYRQSSDLFLLLPCYRYGFVRFKDPESAQAAINGLNGAKLLGHVLQVKFADADAGPPCSGSSSGLTPCDSCYVKNLPTSYGVQQIKGLFARFGGVQDVKIFPCLDHTRGASALVRMESIAAASTAIQHLNGINPPGSLQAILVRYAESSAEKAARLSRKEKLQKVQAPQAALLSAGSLDADQIRQSLAALSFPEVRGAQLPSIPDNAAASHFQQNNCINRSAPNRSAFTSASTSLGNEIHGTGGSDTMGTLVELLFLPEAADKLWVYENFAKFGPIWRVTIEGLGSACILFGSAAAAWAAIMAMDGVISAHGNAMRVRIRNPAAGVAPRSHSLNGTTEEKIAGILGQILPGSIQSMPPTQHINMDPLLRARSEHWH